MSMTPEEYMEFEARACEHLELLQEQLESQYGFGEYERWEYDLGRGELLFSDRTAPKLLAKFQVAGTVSNVTNSWLWSWANRSIPRPVKRDILRVRRFGQKNQVPPLMADHWHIDPDRERLLGPDPDAPANGGWSSHWLAGNHHGWHMAGIAAMLLQAQGAYRCPQGETTIYFVLTDVRRVL